MEFADPMATGEEEVGTASSTGSDPPAGGAPGNDQLTKPTSRPELARFVGRATLKGFRHRRAFRDVERFFFLVGYPRSGSTLVGSLLNAHPEMVIAHEADSLRYVRPGITRNQLFAILLERDREFAAVERRWNGFDYSLPGLDQGRFTRLRVIGDKHAGRAARRMRDEPELLERLRAVAGVPIRVLHITRNPFDNIASIARNRELPLAQAIEIYRDLGVAVDGVRASLSRGELLDLSYESILRDPGGGISAILRFIGVGASSEYVSSCASLVDRGGRRGRATLEWSTDERSQVEAIVASRPVLAGYRFED
jgi:Sulfotransferase family